MIFLGFIAAVVLAGALFQLGYDTGYTHGMLRAKTDESAAWLDGRNAGLRDAYPKALKEANKAQQGERYR